MTKLNYKSYELAALEPSLPSCLSSATLFRLIPSPLGWFLSLSRFTFITMSPLVLFSARSLLSTFFSSCVSSLFFELALLFLSQTFPLPRRDIVLICKKRTVDNIREKWRVSRWGQKTQARWPDRSWGTSECWSWAEWRWQGWGK